MKLITCVLSSIILVELSACNKHALTTKEVPLYIRQSWIKASEPYRSPCICESGVNPTAAFKSIMNTEVTNNPCLKCYYKCLFVKMNLMEQTTGALIEKEFVRQVEGCTSEVFKKCNEKTKNEIDLCKKSFDTYLCIVHILSKPKSSHYPIKVTTPPSTKKPTSATTPVSTTIR
ncbi:hypothetical protein RN001_009957 [Aquatica leii]|uniref:Uncharacterized protein n=1 Tax=Aquatica leii TaxID=1421715 RepID=A0AAN7P8P8_9COLE|nr:hypothetical protein RN001_009957 [Aquatica leii]